MTAEFESSPQSGEFIGVEDASGTVHTPVMVAEVIEWLQAEQGGLFLDCTLGGGGHSEAILRASPNASVVGIDRDARAIARAADRFRVFEERVRLYQGRFSELNQLLADKLGEFRGVLADLGMSTDQLREGRGFSFYDEESLDMRMNENEGVSAAELVNEYSPNELLVVLKRGGVGRDARSIVDAIVRARPIMSAAKLAQVVRKAVAVSTGKRASDPANVTFQALRIAVNNEVEELEALLESLPKLAAPGARAAIICFHSLEDQIVTHQMRAWQSGGDEAPRWGPRHLLGQLLTKKAVLPSSSEVAANAASRSARLRIFQFRGVE